MTSLNYEPKRTLPWPWIYLYCFGLTVRFHTDIEIVYFKSSLHLHLQQIDQVRTNNDIAYRIVPSVSCIKY